MRYLCAHADVWDISTRTVVLDSISIASAQLLQYTTEYCGVLRLFAAQTLATASAGAGAAAAKLRSRLVDTHLLFQEVSHVAA